MIIKTYRHAQILPLLPTLTEWQSLTYSKAPWHYSTPKGQQIAPYLAMYANDPNGLLITAEKGKDLLAHLRGLPLDSPHFPAEYQKLFTAKGYDIHHIFFAGPFLVSSQLRHDRHTIHALYEPFAAFAKAHGKTRIARLELMTKHEPVDAWSEIPGFAKTGIAIDLPWPTKQEGSTLPMMFYINTI